MDAVGLALQPVLVLLAGGVLAVVVCRSLALPPIIGYLAAGVLLGPHALGLVADSAAVRFAASGSAHAVNQASTSSAASRWISSVTTLAKSES